MNLASVLFFLIRHGRTFANERSVYRAWSNMPIAQLDDRGREDARGAAECIENLGASVEVILADSLDRTLESGEIVADVLDVERVVALRKLHPLNVGDLTLMSKDANPIDRYLTNQTVVIPGGESLRQFRFRQLDVFKHIFTLVDAMAPASLAVIGHGSTVSFLHNVVFSPREVRVGYEGLVDPGGVVAVTREGLLPLIKIRAKSGDSIGA